MTLTRRTLAGIAAAFVLVGLGQAPSQADDPGDVVAGTWVVKIKVTNPRPIDFSTRSGTRTYFFGAGCKVGARCPVTRTLQNGGDQKASLTPAGGGYAWRSSQPLSCSDKVTGVVSTPHGADYTLKGKLTPSAFTERDGVRYATAMRGVIDEKIAVNAAGRADNCTSSDNKFVVTEHSVLTATPVPLAAPAASASASKQPLGLDASTTATSGSLTAFRLPQSDQQQASALAVADGRRSSVPGALIAPADAVKNLGPRLGKDLLLVALLGLLMIFPAQLFNSTYEENHERIDRTLGKVRRRRRMRASASPIPLQRTGPEGADAEPAVEEPVVEDVVAAPPARSTRIAVFLGCALVGTLLGGLLDPKFSAGTASYALLVGVFVAVVVAVLLSALSGRTFRAATKRPHDWYLRAIPSALMIAVLCVVVSRLANFQPGYLYGVLGGAVFAVALERRSEGRAEAAVFLASLALAFGAWLAFGAVLTAANGDRPSFGVLTADALLGSLFIGGVEGLLFGMVPLRFLPGYRVKGWSWIAWGLLTAVVLFTFVHVLLLPESGYLGRSTVASVNLTVGLFLAFGLGSVLFWLWFKLRPDAPASEQPEGPAEQPADQEGLELVPEMADAGEPMGPLEMTAAAGGGKP